MIGLKIKPNPMPDLRADAERKINEAFNDEHGRSAQRDSEYAVKRAAAAAILAGGEATPEFTAEAALTGVSVVHLAKVVSTKPDTIAQRGLRRRQAIEAVRSAKTPQEIEQIVNSVSKGAS